MADYKAIFNQVSDIVTPVYLVGGSVRDTILGKEPKDYDFCTPLSPDEVEAKAKAAGRHVYAIGKKFGTIGFKIEDAPKHYQYVEVTTFRTEVYAPGNRKPEVAFVQDIKEDLSRRDFTINAIAYDGDGYIDPYGGRLDIMARKIKAVGEARDRFKEDPLRMLRAARFVSQTGFDIDPNLIGKIRAMARTVTTVSRERWVQEMDKLLVGKHVGRGLLVLKDSYLLKYMLPEVWVLSQNDHLWLNVVQQIQEAPKDADKRWALLLMYIAHPITAQHVLARGKEQGLYVDANLLSKEMATGICSRLKFSNDRRDYVLEAIEKQRLI